MKNCPRGVASIDVADQPTKKNETEASTAAPSLIDKIANRSICVHVKTIRLNGLSSASFRHQLIAGFLKRHEKFDKLRLCFILRKKS